MYSSAQATSFAVSDSSFLPAMAKRTASEMSEGAANSFTVVDYNAFDISLFSVKETVDEKGFPQFKTGYDRQKLVLNLTPGSKWCEVKYKLELGKFDKPDCPFWRVKLVVDEQVAELINQIENEVKKDVLPKVASADSQNECAWKPAVEESLFCAKLIHFSKYPKLLTQCKVRPFKKNVVAVAGSEQLRPFLSEYNQFQGARSKLVVAAESVYILARDAKTGKPPLAGIEWKIHHFVVDLPEPVRWFVPDVFVDICWDDKDE